MLCRNIDDNYWWCLIVLEIRYEYVVMVNSYNGRGVFYRWWIIFLCSLVENRIGKINVVINIIEIVLNRICGLLGK